MKEIIIRFVNGHSISLTVSQANLDAILRWFKDALENGTMDYSDKYGTLQYIFQKRNIALIEII